ncbi:MAG: amino acid ABC transporter permease [Parvibaculales bacterium]
MSRPVPAGKLTWLKKNLFSSPLNSVMTFVGLYVLFVAGAGVLDWAVFTASWSGTDRSACLKPDQGACWPFIAAKLSQFIYGNYPGSELWRPNLVFVTALTGVVWLLQPASLGKKHIGLFMLIGFPVMTVILLSGGLFGLKDVPTNLWGGLLVTLVIAYAGIVMSLPLGVLLALGRQSDLPFVRGLSVVFIEVWRGVPLITVLFMASVMLPLFLPAGVNFDSLLRCLIGVALFAAAYIAEVVRGGLQAIPQGQYEAIKALGLGYWQGMYTVILPQALRISIPGIVNTFIGLFKDTTLVMIVGLFDLMGVVMFHYTDPNWAAPQVPLTGYVFAGMIFWFFCYAMSRYSKHLEAKLTTDHKET